MLALAEPTGRISDGDVKVSAGTTVMLGSASTKAAKAVMMVALEDQ